MSKELHCLAQGKEGVTVGTNTIFYLTHDKIRCIPKDQTVPYAWIIINHRPQKDDPNQVRITVSGNLIYYPYELTTQTADMVSAKNIWNSVIITPGAKFGGADIKNMYLETTLNQYEYMTCPSNFFPMTSLPTTAYAKRHSMATSIWKYAEACTAYPKQGS
jgi:hypothetical protein